MKKSKRQSTEISAGAMADIAFLLLVFFFVCTTIIEEEGILVQLPPWEVEKPPPIPQKNVFNLLVNADNQLMADGEIVDVQSINRSLKEFVLNPNAASNKPNKPTKAVVSLQCNRGASYETYMQVYNELKRGYNEMWEDQAQKKWGMAYSKLTSQDKKLIRSEIPLLISEAEMPEF